MGGSPRAERNRRRINITSGQSLTRQRVLLWEWYRWKFWHMSRTVYTRKGERINREKDTEYRRATRRKSLSKWQQRRWTHGLIRGVEVLSNSPVCPECSCQDREHAREAVGRLFDPFRILSRKCWTGALWTLWLKLLRRGLGKRDMKGRHEV